jgi:hypothetical protein
MKKYRRTSDRETLKRILKFVLDEAIPRIDYRGVIKKFWDSCQYVNNFFQIFIICSLLKPGTNQNAKTKLLRT